jgi:glycosyltransferase involved in cell wall biosynthesis
MRIALVATASTPVRQIGAGSIESMIWLLSHELVKLGHEVTVFATAGSNVDCNLVETLPGTYGSNGTPNNWHLCEWISLNTAVQKSRQFDVIHSHNYLFGIPLSAVSHTRVIHSLHIMPDGDSAYLRERFPDANVTAISRFQWSCYPQFQQPVIYHGLDVSQFQFKPEPDDYVCYLGRFTSGKSPLTAIATARSLGVPIVLAGPRNDYFTTEVEPLVDGTSVRYTGGGIGGSDRNELLGGARALLYPNHEPEPFGLVLAEAMMCGTPVAAIGIGAVPEIVDEELTGSIGENTEDFSSAVLRAMQLDRSKVRQHAETRFVATRMAEEYLHVYEQAN